MSHITEWTPSNAEPIVRPSIPADFDLLNATWEQLEAFMFGTKENSQ